MPYLSFRFYYQSVLDFFQFIRNPQPTIEPQSPIPSKIAISAFLLIMKFTFSMLIAGLIGWFYEPQNLTDQSMSDRFSPLMYLAVGGLILPFFEEALFRLTLIFKPLYLSVSFACGNYYILTKLVYGSKLSMVDDTFLIRITASLAVGIISFFVLQQGSVKSYLTEFWKNHFRLIYYTAAIVFAWLHVLNFEISLTNLLLMPILTLPQLFSGLVSGYLRIRFGFIYPVVLHIGTNSILIGLSLLLE